MNRRHLWILFIFSILFASPALAWWHGRPLGPLQFISASTYGPVQIASAAIPSGVSTTTALTRVPHIVGSGTVGAIRLSFFAWYLKKLVGVQAIGNGYTVNKCAIEYGGASYPITFSGGGRTLSVSSGDTDINSDVLSLSMTQGSTFYIRCQITFAAAATDKFPQNVYTPLAANSNQYLYNPALCTVTNGVDSTGPLTYSTSGCVLNTDIIAMSSVTHPDYSGNSINGFFSPIPLGQYSDGSFKASYVIAGDSIACGAIFDTVNNSVSATGYSQFVFPNGVSSGTGAIAAWNIGNPGGVAGDWAGGSPSLLTAYLKYAKYGMEAYGVNGGTVANSQAIWAQMISAGAQQVFRLSIGPSTSSSDNWSTLVGQTAAAGYGVGSAKATFNSNLMALVSSTTTYVDPYGMRGSAAFDPTTVNYWLWGVNGTNFWSVHSDGLHPTSVGYGLMASGNATVTAQSGTTTPVLSTFFSLQP